MSMVAGGTFSFVFGSGDSLAQADAFSGERGGGEKEENTPGQSPHTHAILATLPAGSGPGVVILLEPSRS